MEIVDKIDIEDILIIFKLNTLCGKTYNKLLDRCIEIIFKSDIELVTLEKSLPKHIVKQIIDIRKAIGLEPPEVENHVKNIYKALDSDDVEFVKMLLTEVHINLDEAYALHFAVAHCDLKTSANLLNLDLADVNLRNQREYTVLHVAAMQNDPKLIVSLLAKGANPLETTFDGRITIMIAKGLTKAADYNTCTEKGTPSLKGGLCIEVLEHAYKLESYRG